MDVIFAVIALPIVLVVCIIFGTLIWLEDRGTIFYLAKRRGKDGTIFNMYKLRSMKVNAPDIRNKDNSTFNSADDPRVTKIGKLMRKISVDELPQVFNILKGDMSVVGNRPLPLYEAELLTSDEYIDRFMAPAGLTGLWQVEKRGNSGKMSADERKQLDIKYAKTFSFWLDMKIILKTVTAFIQKENV